MHTGVIRKAVWNGQEVAVKMFFPETDVNKFKAELINWCSIKHKNVVEVMAACLQKNQLCMVMEYMSEGNLSDYLRKVDTKLPNVWPYLYRVALDVCR